MLFLNNQISEEIAADAVRTALDEGSVTGELFTIDVSTDVRIDANNVTPLKIIEISGTLNEVQ